MPTDASSRVGLTMRGKPRSTALVSGVSSTAAGGVGTPQATSSFLARSLCRAASSVCGGEPVYTSPSYSRSIGRSASNRLSLRRDSHRLNTTAGAACPSARIEPNSSSRSPTLMTSRPA